MGMECLKSVMDGYMIPRVIVTDKELALKKAYDTAFPNAKGLLSWNTLINSHSEKAYQLNLEQLQGIVFEFPGRQVKVEVENSNTEFKKQSRAGKKSLLRKMKEITTPSKTSLNEPATQKATAGRSSFKRALADQPS
ncbi:hypothetical protein Tco_1262181 [Tanacetum coccineum]